MTESASTATENTASPRPPVVRTGDRSESAPDGRAAPDRWRQLRGFIRRPAAGALGGTLIVYAFFVAAAGAHFVALTGTASWLDQAAELGIVAIPIGLLMIAGEFDLSIASVIGAASLTVAVGSGHYHLPLIVSIGIALGLAVVVGLINGIVTVKTGLPSFIVTLSTYFALGGGTLALTRALTTNTTADIQAKGVLHTVFAGSVHQFNVSILWWAGIALLAGHVLSRTVFGNWILATGGDQDAARDAGVPTARVKVALFVATALGAALLGVVQALEYNGAQVGQGEGFIFDAIIAAVIGGVLLQGGYGSATGIVCGAMTYSIVNVGIYYTGWNADLAQLIIGLLVLVAVIANNFLRKLAMSD